jgi:hypothetical protein
VIKFFTPSTAERKTLLSARKKGSDGPYEFKSLE